MENRLLLLEIEKILGNGYKTNDNNYKFNCPNCKHPKKKLEINLETEQWNCWVCGNRDNFKGNKLVSLYRKMRLSADKINELNKFNKHHKHIEISFKSHNNTNLELPLDFTSLNKVSEKDILAKHALNYLHNRGITSIDIERYNIGYCANGEYQNMILIPSYDKYNKLNWFSTRTFVDNFIKTKNPKSSKDIIGFENMINWNVPITICEGAFDAITARRNAIPLFGKTISNELMKKIVTSKTDKIYIALDNDAIKDAIKHCKTLLSFNKEVYLVYLDKKDINEMGFNNFLNIIQQTQPLTFDMLMDYKFKI